MFLAVPVTVCLALSCAATPASENWVAPAPGSAPAGSPVALHGQLRVVSVPTIDKTGNPGVDAGDPSIDAGNLGVDVGNAGIDPGNPGIDLPVTPAVRSQLVDQHGAPIQLKGVSSQWLQWESKAYPESKAGLAYMRDQWKVSAIRAAMGTEQSSGYFDATANIKKQVETIIHNAIDLGVYVLVDWHTEKAVDQQDAAVDFFTEMATKYGAYPNVIWEPYNEPNRYSWSEIKLYHQAVVDAIRNVDPDNLIVLGTPNWSQNVDQAALDPVVGTNLLYTLHFYACEHGEWLRTKGNTAMAAGLALFVTEFGATFSDGGLVASQHNYVCEDESQLWFEWMVQNGISGVAWKFDQCTDSSCILNPSAPVNGPWPADKLSSDVGGAVYARALGVSGTAIQGGHGQFVVNWLRQ